MSTSIATLANLLVARGFPPFANQPDLACRPDLGEKFFPSFQAPRGEDIREAKQICRRCPARDACLAWAVQTQQDHGVWGATTPQERKRLLKHAKPGPAVHLVRHDQAVTDCCGWAPGELPRAQGHRLTGHRDRVTCPALSTGEDA